MRSPETSRTALAIGWLGRALLLFGGTALAVRAGLPAAAAPGAHAINPDEQPAKGGLDDGDTGRGHPETPPSRQALHERHEVTDLPAGTLARLVAGLGIAATIVAFGIVGFRHLVTASLQRAEPTLTTEQTTPIQPPTPTLQADPVAELAQLHAREDTLLTGYAWRDAAHTQARIPLARAKQLIIGHKLDTAP